MARVLRPRYFLNSTFLDARLGSKSSYTWRSILAGRAVLEKGLILVVGNGDTIRVWTDPWLFYGGSPWVSTDRGDWPEEGRVCELLGVDSQGWNEK